MVWFWPEDDVAWSWLKDDTGLDFCLRTSGVHEGTREPKKSCSRASARQERNALKHSPTLREPMKWMA
jgi:hypothetical protein